MERCYVASPRWGNLCFGETGTLFEGPTLKDILPAAEAYAQRETGRVAEDAKFEIVNLGVTIRPGTISMNGFGARTWYIFRSAQELLAWARGEILYPGIASLDRGEMDKEPGSPQMRPGWSIGINARWDL